MVTPLAGVWIEMSIPPTLRLGLSNVTPLAGVWIEIICSELINSHISVTPLAGVWIEMISEIYSSICSPRHSPCGSVD